MSGSTIRWYERAFAAVFVYVLYFGGYGFINRRISLEACTDLTLAADRHIPFVSGFVAPFYLAYVVVLLPAILISQRRLLIHALSSFSVLVMLSCVVFVAFPTYVPRPVLMPVTLSDHLVAAIYKGDRPCCAFPSLHVSSAVLCALVLRRQRPAYDRLLWPCVVAIAASTVFIKQHVLLDVMGGFAIAAAIEWALYRWGYNHEGKGRVGFVG